jgi:hypothetical protein
VPIITKAGSPVKGSPTEFTLDKAALALLIADAYYADEDNWKEVVLNYKSSTGKQKEIVKFDASLASPAGNFAVSLKARDVFEIHKIVIKDFDGGSFEVPRSALTTAEFDVDMGAPVGPPIDYIDWDIYTFGVHTLGPEGFIQKLGEVLNYGLSPRSIPDQIAPNADFNLTFEALDTDMENGWSVGLAKNSNNLANFPTDQFVFVMDGSNTLSLNSENVITVSGIVPITGTNYINITRISGQMFFYVNGSQAYTTTYSGLLLPLVRLGGTVRKAYKQ